MINLRVTNLGLLSRYKWRLDETYVHRVPFYGCEGSDPDGYVSIDKKGLLRLEKGYCWNGASGPTIDTISVRRASALHDGWYQLISLGIVPISSKAIGDNELYVVMIEDFESDSNIAQWLNEKRATLWRWAVDKFGWLFIHRKSSSRKQDYNQ